MIHDGPVEILSSYSRAVEELAEVSLMTSLKIFLRLLLMTPFHSEGGATDSQAFAFEDGQSQLALQPSNAADTCLVPDGGKLDSATCNGNAEQQFQIG